jgi:hypothetical protein
MLRIVGGLLSLGLLGLLGFRQLGRYAARGDWGSIVALVGMVVMGGIGAWLLARGKRYLAPTVAELLAVDPRPPVLYLRVFRDDRVTAAAGGGAAFLPALTEEEQLAHVMSQIGPFIAIGQPGEALPELGAARVYVGEAEWQAAVEAYMARARLVVLRAGDSEAFWWEVERARRQLRPEQVVFLVPHDATAYEAFRQRAQAHLERPLPDHPGRVPRAGSLHGLIYFAPKWVPRFVPFPRAFFRTGARRALVGRLTYAFRPVFEQLGVPWRPPPLGWWTLYVTIMIVMGIVALAVIGGLALLGWLD